MMTWYFDKRNKKNEKLRHLADDSQWRKIDGKYQDFGREHRNVRFTLSTDGMNPFGYLSSTHNTWPVVLSILNLPSYLCMKRKYLMLAILIQGPRQPRSNMDVFLVPLLEDMAKLWNEGERMRDQFRQEDFTLHAMILYSVIDYPSGFSLSGH